MEAMGEHLLIRQPKKSAHEGPILLPEEFQKAYSYGEVISVGPLAGLTGVASLASPLKEGDFVVFDFQGVRPLELHPNKDADVVVAHASQIFCRIHPDQLRARKLPLS